MTATNKETTEKEKYTERFIWRMKPIDIFLSVSHTIY